ncbi:MAG TPA: TldD/PmbA family protein [Acidimicrobiales bacterium]|jgi:predicted Zn-dependent protease|nr:TldD/PmbA family protein [Acidimicrobiales bacterium]HWH34674.1 TldD/PmbA family protein [Acidimicrobiales bacterium]
MRDLDGACDYVLGKVGDRAEAEVTVVQGRSALTRFANSYIHQNVAQDFRWARLRVSAGGRLASASTDRTDDEGLTGLVERTLAAAQLRAVDPDWPGLAPPARAPEVRSYDEATHFADPALRAEVVRDFVDAGEGLRAAGFCDSDGSFVAFANSAGQRLEGRRSSSTIEAIHRTAMSDGRGWQSSSRLSDIDGSATGRTAAEKARRGDDLVALEPGRYEVVLEPSCLANMLEFLRDGFNARTFAEGRSFVELGEGQLDPSITLWDDATDPRAISRGFDAEGTPKRRLDLVRAGVPVALCHDRRTAAKAGTESTGHGMAGGESAGAWAQNLFMAPGARSPGELIASVERGLLVTEFWYTRILDPKTQVVTGLTRNGTFLIEGGRVVGGVPNLRFTQSYVDALRPGNVLGIADDARLFNGTYHVPTVRLASWNFTGGAKG